MKSLTDMFHGCVKIHYYRVYIEDAFSTHPAYCVYCATYLLGDKLVLYVSDFEDHGASGCIHLL